MQMDIFKDPACFIPVFAVIAAIILGIAAIGFGIAKLVN